MTAEALVMNKHGIAIAADSVIATPTSSAPKIFNTMNKLFNLSFTAPVAVMIYGSSEIAQLPWETLIKDYRAKLGAKTHATIDDYLNDFLQYLSKIEFSQDEKSGVFLTTISAHFFDLAEEIKIASMGSQNFKAAGETGIQQWICEKLQERLVELDAMVTLPAFAEIDQQNFYLKFRREIRSAQRVAFGAAVPVPLTREIRHLLWQLAYNFAVKDVFSSLYSGVVIAGFGDTQMMPSTRGIRLESMFADTFKIRMETKRDITGSNQGMIIPFAQTEMVYRFLQGVDKGYNSYVFDMFAILSREIANYAVNKFVSPELKQSANSEITGILDAKLASITQEAQRYRRDNFALPIIDAVKNLPKHDLAALAEALVQLTSLRRKMSIDLETVGEPIDVAVVSKGDGFVWIKRKLYFDASLNPHLMEDNRT